MLYNLAHEGGHAIAMLCFGGKITEFSISFWNLQAHVACRGDFDNLQNLVIQLSGILFPVLVWWIFLVVAPKGTVAIIEIAKILSTVTILSTLGAWVFLTMLYEYGYALIGDDTAEFMRCSGVNGYVVAGAFLILIGICIDIGFHHICLDPPQKSMARV